MAPGDYQATIYAGTEAGLQSAISAGGEVRLGPGTFTISSGLTSVADSLSIIGSGMGVTVLNYTGGGTCLDIATGGGVSKNHTIRDLTIQIGANQTGPVVKYTGGDFFWSIENLAILNPATGFTVGTGLQLLNCQNGIISNLVIRGADATKPWAYCLDIDINDSAQRGNIIFNGGMLNNGTVGLAICRSAPANSVNNCVFNGTKFVNSLASLDSTIGADLYGQADQTAFINCHFERFQTAIRCAGADDMQVIGGLFSQIHNDANNAGDCFLLSGVDGVFISSPRCDTVYNILRNSGVSQRCTYIGGLTGSLSGAEYTDTSNGANGNLFIKGGTIQSATTAVGRLKATAAFGFDSAGTPLAVSSNTITATKGYHQVDNSAGDVTLNTISGLNDGDVLVLRPNSDAHLVTINQGASLFLKGTYVLRSSSESLTLIKVGTNWMELARSENSYGITNGRGIDITAAATIGIPTDGNVFHVVGNTNVTNGITVNASDVGRVIALIFEGTPTVSDTGTSKLAGNFVAAGTTNDYDTLTLACDGTNWYELARSAN